MTFDAAYTRERLAFHAAQRAYWTRRRAEWRFRDRLRNWGVGAALSRLQSGEDFAEHRHRLAAADLARLWDRASSEMPPHRIANDTARLQTVPGMSAPCVRMLSDRGTLAAFVRGMMRLIGRPL